MTSSVRNNLFAVLVCTIVATIQGCAPSRFVRPLNKGATAISANIGGPLIQYGSGVIPLPLSSIAVGHGYSNNVTGFAGLHTTALLFGVIQTDIGVVKKITNQNKWLPAISVSPVANMMFDKWEKKFSFFPQVDAHAYWEYGKKKSMAYAGISNWIDLHSKRADGRPQTTHWLPTMQAGNTFCSNNWAYTVELRWVAPNQSNKNLIVEYKAPGNSGAMGVYFGVTRSLGRKKTTDEKK